MKRVILQSFRVELPRAESQVASRSGMIGFRKPQRLRASAGKSCSVISYLILFLSCAVLSLMAGEYFEGFDSPGKPLTRDGIRWGYTDELTPVAGWKDLIPGDGYAYLGVQSRVLKQWGKKTPRWPFQTLSLGPVGSNTRISMRARNAAIQGVACLLFTYREQRGVNEIDIEITAGDSQGNDPGHKTDSKGGWSDIRLNTWSHAVGDPTGVLRPGQSIRMPIRNRRGERVSHRDGKFHIYTIEWRRDSVRFLIDGVPQGRIREIVPDVPSSVIFGMRRMPWAGSPTGSGTETMTVDWIDVEPLDQNDHGHRVTP